MRFLSGYLKPEFNKSGMKQITDSGFKTFDRQNICVSTGNVLSSCQTSFYLDDYTIKTMPKHWEDVDSEFLQYIANLADKVIFYEFFVRYKGKKHVFYQTAVDAEKGNKVWERLFTKQGDYNKRKSAAKWIDMYITKQTK